MPDSHRPDSSRRLEKALSGISTSEMKAVRAEVENEISRLSSTPVPPIPPPPASVLAAGKAVDQAIEAEGPRHTNIEELEKAGKIADDFLLGMDRITDVLMLLVLKFGRASTLTRAVFIGNICAVLLLVANLIAVWTISMSQTAVQAEQEKIQRQQAEILSVAGDAQKKAAAAEQKATEVQQKQPEVVVDAKGRPQLILKVQNPEEGAEKTKTLDAPKKSKITDGSGGANSTLQVPL